MLEIAELEVRYGKTPAVRALNVHVAEGEVVALIGPNGAGKTTTLSAITGTRSIARGTISFDGQVLNGRSPEWIVQQGTALVPEGRRIFGTLTVEENLRLGATTRRATYRTALADIFGRFPILEEYRGTLAGRLSGGEQQQLAIARALLARPRLLLLDEPSLGLAPLVVKELFSTLNELRNAGVTMLLVEQNARKAIDLADRTYVMAAGQLTFHGDRASFGDEFKQGLEGAYFGR